MATTHCSKTSYISMRASSRKYRMMPRLRRYFIHPSVHRVFFYSVIFVYDVLCIYFDPFQDAFDEAVKFFGESSKTMSPSVFFPVFVRFVKAYRVNPLVRHLLNDLSSRGSNLTRGITQNRDLPRAFLHFSKRRRKTNRGKGRSRC